jgi:predicted transcriptional regulator
MAKNRYSIDLSSELDRKLEELAANRQITKAELIRRALALYALVDEQTSSKNHELALVDENNKVKVLITIP